MYLSSSEDFKNFTTLTKSLCISVQLHGKVEALLLFLFYNVLLENLVKLVRVAKSYNVFFLYVQKVKK